MEEVEQVFSWRTCRIRALEAAEAACQEMDVGPWVLKEEDGPKAAPREQVCRARALLRLPGSMEAFAIPSCCRPDGCVGRTMPARGGSTRGLHEGCMGRAMGQ